MVCVSFYISHEVILSRILSIHSVFSFLFLNLNLPLSDFYIILAAFTTGKIPLRMNIGMKNDLQ